MTEEGRKSLGAVCGNREGRKAELSGWAGREAGCLQLWGSDLSSPRRALRQTRVSRGPSTSGGDQVVRGKVGRGCRLREREESGVVPV